MIMNTNKKNNKLQKYIINKNIQITNNFIKSLDNRQKLKSINQTVKMKKEYYKRLTNLVYKLRIEERNRVIEYNKYCSFWF